ncbi:MAG: hypothetical protein M3N68_00390 [Actinomycetota bacterium]|nr:hypothetical protein [Actinomycetota bacterium]
MTVDVARRQALLDAKLRALVSDRWGPLPPTASRGTFPGGATIRHEGSGWVLAQDQPERALGAALAWASQAGVDHLHVLAEASAGLLARRAAAFSRPPAVWLVEGRNVVPAAPEELTPQAPVPPEVASLAAMLEDAGVEPVVEHGLLLGEVLGLEVVRVVAEDFGPRLEVGVGRFDRDLHRLVHPDRAPQEALAAAAALVRRLRRAGAPSHQANQLAKERWLRAVVVAHPELVGATSLAPVPSPVLRANLRQRAPAPAAGLDLRGDPVLAVCSTGIDLDLVPVAADARLADERRPRLVLVVPEADDHPFTRELASALAEPAEVVAVPGDWRRLGSL